MNSELNAFLLSIREGEPLAPLADWLEERGDPRSGVLREVEGVRWEAVWLLFGMKELLTNDAKQAQ